jgi:hypothetical protein
MAAPFLMGDLMPSPVIRVRQSCLVFALLAPLAAADAQVAIQVKSGTTWTANITISSVGPITFRWRWDGTESLTGVGWQLATVTPTSTATTRSTDVVAGDTPMRLPAVKGGYQEFTVTPQRNWPAKFYIRVRATAGRKVAYSRWVTVTTVTRTEVAGNPTCTFEAWKHTNQRNVAPLGVIPEKTEPIVSGEIVQEIEFPEQRIWLIIKNRTSTAVTYRRNVTLSVDGKPFDWLFLWVLDNASLGGSALHTSTIEEPDTVKVLLVKKTELLSSETVATPPYGVLRFDASVTPTSGKGSTCSFAYTFNQWKFPQ